MNLEQQTKMIELSKILDQLDPHSSEYKLIIRMITEGYEMIKYVPPKFTSVSNNIIYTAKIEYRQYKRHFKGKHGDILLHQNTLDWMQNKMHLNLSEWQESKYFYRRLIPKKN